ncbi:hypothetical protein D3C86_1379400 [compost metagenome]
MSVPLLDQEDLSFVFASRCSPRNGKVHRKGGLLLSRLQGDLLIGGDEGRSLLTFSAPVHLYIIGLLRIRNIVQGDLLYCGCSTRLRSKGEAACLILTAG